VITIVPSIEIMKAVTDMNISSPGAEIRRDAFDVAIDLKSLADVKILLDGSLYERMTSRLEESHKVFFDNICNIDNSAKGCSIFNVIGAVRWIAESESKSRKTIILSENPGDFSSLVAANKNVVCLKPSDFLYKVNNAKILYESRDVTSLGDALVAVFFLSN
jgi:hypothetical protein